MRSPALLLAALLLWLRSASAQTVTNAQALVGSSPSAIEDELKKWAFSASIMGYIVPESRDYVQPTITADRGWLHVETRYNYENLETASAWLGYNFSGGSKVAWEVTPMLGAVFGDATGIAPGLKGSLSWWKLELYSEDEYVFDSSHSSGSFFYNWSELTFAPVEWFRVGIVTQRTRAYQTDRDIQRGFLVGLSYRKLSFTTYVFNPDESKPTIILGAGLRF